MMRYVAWLAVVWVSRELLRGLLHELACAGVRYSNSASSNDG